MKKAWLLTAIPPLAVWDVYKFIFARSRPPVLNALLDKKTHRPEYYVWRDEHSAALVSKVHLCYTLESDRGEILQGFYFPCGKKFSQRDLRKRLPRRKPQMRKSSPSRNCRHSA